MQTAAEPPVVLSQVQHTALDDILRPHLRLEPLRETEKTENVRGERSPGKAVTQPSRGHVLGSHGKVYRIRTGPRHWEAYSWEMSLYLKKKILSYRLRGGLLQFFRAQLRRTIRCGSGFYEKIPPALRNRPPYPPILTPRRNPRRSDVCRGTLRSGTRN